MFESNKYVIVNNDNMVVELQLEYRNGKVFFSTNTCELTFYTHDEIDNIAYEVACETVENYPSWVINNPNMTFNQLVESMDIEDILGDVEDYKESDKGFNVWSFTSGGQDQSNTPSSIVELWDKHHMKEVSDELYRSIIDTINNTIIDVNQEWGF